MNTVLASFGVKFAAMIVFFVNTPLSLLATPGALDPLNVEVVGGEVLTSAVQPDGKVIIAGRFINVLGQVRSRIARLNTDGTLDASFDPNANGVVYSVAVQADGGILLSGFFSYVQGQPRNCIARVTADGTLDASFNPTANTNLNGGINTMVVQLDGKILLGGNFTNMGLPARKFIVRVAADGTLDAGFNPNVNSEVSTMAVQADGKILLGGRFTTVGGSTSYFIARVAADGTIDAVFNPNFSGGYVSAIAVQLNDKILVSGGFTNVDGGSCQGIVRLNTNGSRDWTFNSWNNGYVNSMAVQADGQILLGGNFTIVGAAARRFVARVTADGSRDVGFNPDVNGDSIDVNTVAVQADGKILIGGNFFTVSGIARKGFARLFNYSATQTLITPNTTEVTWNRAGSAPDVSIVTFELSTNGGASYTTLGTATRVGSTANWQLTGLSLPPSGQIRARGRTSGGYNNSGSGMVEQVRSFGMPEIAVSCNSVDISNGDNTPSVADYSDFGNINIAGASEVRTFTIKNTGDLALNLTGTPMVVIGGLNADDFSLTAVPTSPVAAQNGTTTFLITFDPSGPGIRSATLSIANDDSDKNPYSFAIQGAGVFSSNADLSALLTNADVLMPNFDTAITAYSSSVSFGTTSFTVTPTQAEPNATIQVRVNDARFASVISGSVSTNLPLNIGSNTIDILVTAQDGITTKLYTLNTNRRATILQGELDSLNANVVGESVMAIALQPDGKTIIAGGFSSVLGIPRNNIARFNADGTVDTSFDPNTNGYVYSVAVQADGQILLGGNFTIVGGSARNFIARVAANGTIDASFDPNANNPVLSMAVQSDGGILLGGGFTTVGGASRNFIARVTAYGTLDAGFNPQANGSVNSVAVQADGKILIAGWFTTIGGSACNFIARVGAGDGTLDTSFAPSVNDAVYSVVVEADGRILLGGIFSYVQGQQRNYVARVSANGTLDVSFNPLLNNAVYSMAVQADGQILLGGEFSIVNGNMRNRVARVFANGVLDTGFNSMANDAVYSLAVQADGKILLGGSFTTVGGINCNLFARLFNYSATQTLITPNTTEVTWNRAGSAPDVSIVTFELSTNGGASYTTLGTATRVGSTANWQLTGLSLPPSGQIRARGRTSGASGLVERIQVFGNGNIAFDYGGYTVIEGGTAILTINRSASTNGIVQVTVATSSLSTAPAAIASVVNDYNAKTQVFTFADGESSKSFEVQTLMDTRVEPNETFLVKLSVPRGGAMLGSVTTARVTIVDPSTLTNDVTAPVLAVTAPAMNALVGVKTGDSMNLIGTATDTKGVDKVAFKVLTAGGSPADFSQAMLGTMGGSSTTFIAPITPVTGTNTVEIKVADFKGNIKSLTRTFKVARPLQVTVTGNGTVSPGFAGTTFREVDKPLNITATSATGYVFDGWMVNNSAGTGITTAKQEFPSLTFNFTEGLVLRAKFIANPFTTALVGVFNGLILPSIALPAPSGTASSISTVGLFNIVIGTRGSFTCSLKIDGVSLSTSGFFDNDGMARFSASTRSNTLTFKRAGKSDLEIALNMNMTPGSGKLAGTVTQKLGGTVQHVSNIDADRAYYSTANKVSTSLAGTTIKPYTIVFPAKTQSPMTDIKAYPQGDGYATMTVHVNGSVYLTGKLADNTSITSSAPLSKQKLWPIFAQLYKLRGCFAGMAALSDADAMTEDVIGSSLQWFRPSQSAQWYPEGWPAGISVDMNGARYVVPPALPLVSVFPGLLDVNPKTGNASLTLAGGLLNPFPLPYDINISTSNRVTNAPGSDGPTLVIDKASGKLTGTFIHTELTKPTTYQGVIIQKGSKQGGWGYFMSRETPLTYLGESGKVQVLAK